MVVTSRDVHGIAAFLNSKLISVSQYFCSASLGVRIFVLGQFSQCNCEGEEVRI